MADPSSENLPPPTVPASYETSLRGFHDEKGARQVGEVVGSYIYEISRLIDAERLDGVTVAFDYDEALASLDRGIEGLHPLTRTKEHATGVAMAPAVLRDGVVKGHLVIHGSVAEALLDENHKWHKACVYTLAHELGHIHDIKFKDRAFPGTILHYRHDNDYDGYLFQIAEICWDEFVASKLSAPFFLEQVKNYEEVFLTTLSKAKEETDREIAHYRVHGDVKHLLHVAIDRYGNLMKYASYLIGHLQGMSGSLEADAPDAAAACAGSYFQETYRELDSILFRMWESYGTWSGLEIYDDLKMLCWSCLREAGLVMKTIEAGQLYVEVP